MAEKNTFPFTALVSHLNKAYPCQEFVTVSATKRKIISRKALAKRQADTCRIREEHPDKIPVIVQKADNSRIPYEKQRLQIPAEFTLAEFFTYTWSQLYEIKFYGETYFSLRSTVKHQDPIFEKLMSSVYEECKDEDGYLYITLSGEKRDINMDPAPSNISTYTDFDTVRPLPLEDRGRLWAGASDTLAQGLQIWQKIRGLLF